MGRMHGKGVAIKIRCVQLYNLRRWYTWGQNLQAVKQPLVIKWTIFGISREVFKEAAAKRAVYRTASKLVLPASKERECRELTFALAFSLCLPRLKLVPHFGNFRPSHLCRLFGKVIAALQLDVGRVGSALKLSGQVSS
jgi:hypothetical protein